MGLHQFSVVGRKGLGRERPTAGSSGLPRCVRIPPDQARLWVKGRRSSSLEQRVPHDAKSTLHRCPKCNLVLFTFRYPQTHVDNDMCPEYRGLWLNPREFKEIKTVRIFFTRRATSWSTPQ